MKIFLIACVVLALAAGALAQAPKAAPPGGISPAEISGMYTFLRDGEYVEVDAEDQGRVTGFISRYGEADSDRGAFLDHLFTRGSLQGNKLTFATKAVHGISFEFEGTVARGDGKTPTDEGYWVINGTLTQLTTDENKKTTTKSRAVVFKSFPQDVQAPAKKPD